MIGDVYSDKSLQSTCQPSRGSETTRQSRWTAIGERTRWLSHEKSAYDQTLRHYTIAICEDHDLDLTTRDALRSLGLGCEESPSQGEGSRYRTSVSNQTQLR
jgi:hypothetical protein